MKSFQITFGNWSTIIQAANKTDAQAWADNYRPGEPNTVVEVATVARTEAEKLEARQLFGKGLLNQYLLDNDAIAAARGYPLTVTESNQQATKFQSVMGVLPLGSLRQALAIIEATATDTIFTQERKDAYVTALTDFIAAQ
jgi:hypothetical protein